jgi:transcriptional regulator with XRE-family HTH domain
MSQLGDRIRTLRFSKDIKSKDLAEKAGISEQALNALERGRVENPGFLTVTRIAENLDVSMEYLYKGIPSFSRADIAALKRHRPLLEDLQEILQVILPKLEEEQT